MASLNGFASTVRFRRYLAGGHNRYEICQEDGIEFKTVEKHFEDLEAVKVWMAEDQLAKRNTSPEEARVYRGQVFNYRKKKQGAPKGNENAGKTDEKQRCQVDTFVSNEESKKTAEKVAAELGVSPRTIARDGERAAIHDAVADDPEAAEAAKKLSQADIVAPAVAALVPKH